MVLAETDELIGAEAYILHRLNITVLNAGGKSISNNDTVFIKSIEILEVNWNKNVLIAAAKKAKITVMGLIGFIFFTIFSLICDGELMNKNPLNKL